MELTPVQKLMLLATLIGAATQNEELTIDLKASEASMIQVKLLELIEERGEEQAEQLLGEGFTETVRSLYNDVIGGA